MSWTVFLQTLGERQEHALTPHELEVILCLNEEPGQSKQQLLEAYQRRQGPIEEEAFTQRLRTIYRKFNVSGRGYKLPQLQRYLVQQYQQSGPGLSRFGLSRIHAAFPTDTFTAALERLLHNQEQAMDDDHKVDDSPVETHKEVAILQTFAPNLEHYRAHLSRCLQAGVRVRILLAWPYSLAAGLREEVLKRYAAEPLAEDFAIQSSVIANLETLEATIRASHHRANLEIRLYDTLPSLSLYRAGSTLLAAPFLHGALAIHTFQLELDLRASDALLTGTLLNDFERMWTVARPFLPAPDRNWRNELKILFTN
ncbi:hypothetical protein [Vulcanococcus limneticus]|uniref:hypothetical protein n=1 Tax=Vulcanococcus limneticus TaxID=2170428 RepID=UPI00398BE880